MTVLLEKKTVEMYYFTCTKCGKDKRQSVKELKARDGLCKKCRKLKQDDRQATLFDLPVVQEGSNEII